MKSFDVFYSVTANEVMTVATLKSINPDQQYPYRPPIVLAAAAGRSVVAAGRSVAAAGRSVAATGRRAPFRE